MTHGRVTGRLAIRQALIAALLGLALGIAFSALEVGYDYRESERWEQREIDQMLSVMREPAAQAAYHLSEQGAAVVVKGALSYAPVRQAVLSNDFGETLASGRNEVAREHADAWWARFVAPTRDHRLVLEYGPGRQRVGELHLVTSRGPRVERFLEGVWRALGLSIVRSLLIALALGGVFYLTLTRPLAAIAARIRLGPDGGHDAPLAEAVRADEIGEIAKAFARYEREGRERTRSLEDSAAALAASELRYRRIVETAGEGVWQVDEQGLTTLANDAMAGMLGLPAPQLVGRSIHEFLDDDGRQAAASLLQRRHGGGSDRREVRFLRSDGRELWAEVSTCPITHADGRPAGTLAMVTDITERRRRDEQLRASNARLRTMVGNLERHKRDMAQIAELNELLQSARTESEAYEVIRASALRLFAEGSGGLSMAGPGGELVRVGEWGGAGWVPPRFSPEVCWAIRRGGPHLQSAGSGVRCAHQPDPALGAVLCSPLYVEGQLLGVLHLAGGTEGDGGEEALRRRAELFGEVIKLGLSNLRLRENLREQAVLDPLTGLPNRRLFDETLPRELARSVRSGQPLTVAVVDVDHFKHFNDTYGHEAGDRVLRSVAARLASSIRSGDLACRYGGDEFMCLLVGMTAAHAQSRFAEALADTTVYGDLDPAMGHERVTFTVGLATAPECGTDVAALLRAADEALYAAKGRGRNCIEIAQPRRQVATA